MANNTEQDLIAELKQVVTSSFPLSQMSDEDLKAEIVKLVDQRLTDKYCPIEERLSVIQQIYSSIRGFGLLDSIILLLRQIIV